MSQINGLQDFSGTKADREYWTHDTMDAEKEILKMKAHKKLLSSGTTSRGPSRNANSSVDQNGIPIELSARTKHKRRQCQLNNKRRKAKKGQQKAQNNQKQNASQAPAVVTKSDP